MAFFRNDTVNRLNLHYGVHALAISGGGAFFGVFLLKSGVPAPLVLAALAAILTGRFLIRPLILPAVRRIGLRPMVIAGTILAGCQYPLLAEVRGIGWPLAALCMVSSVSDAVYWTCYHAYFASLGDAEHRGHQIGAREAIAAAAGIVGPLAAGWTLAAFGPRPAFWATGVVLVLSALPIFGAPNVRIVRSPPGAYRAARLAIAMFAADGWIASGILLVWPLALFRALGDSFAAFGGAMALAALAGAVCSLALGRFIDLGHGGRAVWLAMGSVTLLTVFRAVSYGNAATAVIANAAGALAPAFYTPTLMTAVYNQAKTSPCAFRFHFATEGGWDVGGASACLAAAAIMWAGAPFWMAILLSLLGAAANFVLLRGYYGAGRPAAAAAPAVGEA